MVPRFTVPRRWCLALIAAGFVLAGCSDDNCVQHDCYTAGSIAHSTYFRDYEYASRRVFDLGLIRYPATSAPTRFLLPSDQVVAFELYVFASSPSEPDGQAGRAYTFWPDPNREGMDSVSTLFRRVSQSELPYVISENAEGWFLLLGQPSGLVMGRTVAYYVKYTRNGVTYEIGDKTGELLRLQLLTYPAMHADDPLWVAEWRNVYDLGVRNLDYDNMAIDIFKGPRGSEDQTSNSDSQNGVPYLQLLGLDQADRSGSYGHPDNKIDIDPVILDLNLGLLIFPDRRPFDTDVGYSVMYPDVTLNPRLPVLYDSDQEYVRRSASTYYIRLTARSRPLRFYLGRINLIPESEIVTLNGRRLSRGIEYKMDYQNGAIQFYTDQATDPNADVEVCFDYCP